MLYVTGFALFATTYGETKMKRGEYIIHNSLLIFNTLILMDNVTRRKTGIPNDFNI